MIIRNLEIENFGRFSGVSFEFRRGMNLVIGPNEAGKSTLAEAIPAVLFGSRQVERFKPWGRTGCAARLIFEGDGRTVEVRRDLLNDDVSLVERDDLYQTLSNFTGRVPPRGKSVICREYRDLLERLLGVAEDDLYRATCFFGQTMQEWTGDALADKLRQLVSGSHEADFSHILDSLLTEHFNLTCKNPWGRDKQKARELEKLRSRMEDVSRSPGATFSLGSPESSEQQELIRKLVTEVEQDRRDYVKGVCYIDRLRQSHQQESDAREAAQPVDNNSSTPEAGVPADNARAELRSHLVAAGFPADPPSELPEILDQAAAIRQELAEVQQPLTNLQRQKQKVRPVRWLMIGVGTVLATIVIVLGFLLDFYPLLTAAVGGCLGILLLAWGIFSHIRRRRVLAEFDRQLSKLEQTRAAVLDRQTLLSERCEVLGLPTSAVDLVRLQKLVAANRELLDAWWSGADGPADSEPVAFTAEQRAETLSENVGSEPSASQAELADLEKRLAEFAASLKEKEAELARLRGEGEKTASAASLPEAAAESDLHAQCRKMERRVAVLRTAVDLLVDGVEDFRQTHMKSLTAEAGRLFGRMTRDRYNTVRLDEEMRPEVKIAERRWVPANRLSRGTLDALYLALRIALAKVRSDGRALPLLLDDPFVHLDRSRMSAVMKLLDVAAAGGQLILLSHSDELGRRAARERWHVIALGEQSAGATEKDDEHGGQLHLL